MQCAWWIPETRKLVWCFNSQDMWFPSLGKIIFLFIIITVILLYFENYLAFSAIILVLSMWIVSVLDIGAGDISPLDAQWNTRLWFYATSLVLPTHEWFRNSFFVLPFSVFTFLLRKWYQVILLKLTEAVSSLFAELFLTVLHLLTQSCLCNSKSCALFANRPSFVKSVVDLFIL